jgi:excisionase family DNA binding protein
MRYYTAKEVADLLNVSQRTVYNWVAFGFIKAVKVGEQSGKGSVRIRQDALDEFIEKNTTIDVAIKMKRKY